MQPSCPSKHQATNQPIHKPANPPHTPKVSLVKGFVGRALARDTADIDRDREGVARLAAETAAMAAEAARLRTQPHVFQNSR
jgi:hypothetical protein